MNARTITDQVFTVASCVVVAVVISLESLPEAALLFAMLVGVPAAIRIEQLRPDPLDRLARLRSGSTLPCAVIASIGLFLPESPLNSLVVAMWAIPTLLLIAERVRYAFLRRRSTIELCRLASSLYLLVAVVWMVCWKIGFSPFDFPLGITLLTAVHFHYAGFLLPQLALRLQQESPGSLTVSLNFGVVLGLPLVATGMLWSRPVEFAGVLLVVLCTVSIAILQFRNSRAAARPVEKMMFGLAVLCATVAAGLALVYGWSEYEGVVRIQIPQMLRWHGMLNAFGLIGLSLCARSLSGPDPI